jgi:hypothetical protein
MLLKTLPSHSHEKKIRYSSILQPSSSPFLQLPELGWLQWLPSATGNGSLLDRNIEPAVSQVVPVWLNGARQLADVFGIQQRLGFVGMLELVAVRLLEDVG